MLSLVPSKEFTNRINPIEGNNNDLIDFFSSRNTVPRMIVGLIP